MKNFKKLFLKYDEEKEIKKFIEQVNMDEEHKIIKYQNKRLLVNPSALRLECQPGQEKFCFYLKIKNHCPV